jgi:hypothetical protein
MDENRLLLALSRYQNRIPLECFIADVPDWLRYFDDHVVTLTLVKIASSGNSSGPNKVRVFFAKKK